MTRLPGRLIETWRALDTPTRVLAISAAAGLFVVVLVVGYLVVKRPGDVFDPEAEFRVNQREVEKKENTNWPIYGYDLERTRYLPAKGVEPPFSERFLFDAGELLEFSPIYVDGVLYVMNKNAEFFALDAGNGKVIWKRDVGALNASAPAYEDGVLYAVNLEPGQAMALRAKDGKRLWTRDLPGRSESSPLVHDGSVYFGTESGDVFALDAKDGSDVWHIDTAGSVKAGPAYHDGTLYVGDYAGHMYAIRASDGAIRWDTSDLGVGFGRSGRFYATPAVAFGRVYAGNADGRIYSFEASSGDIAWTQSTGAAVYAAPAVADTPGTPPSVYIGSADHYFYALNADSGDEVWRADMGGLITGAASVVGNTVYASAINLDLTRGFDIADGEVVYEIDKGEYNPVISDGRRIYLTGYAGITKLTPKEGGKGKGGDKKGKKAGGEKGKKGDGMNEGKGKKGKGGGKKRNGPGDGGKPNGGGNKD